MSDEYDDIINVSKLADIELSDIYRKTVDELFVLHEALAPTTQKGRDLHSLRTALLVELSARGLR